MMPPASSARGSPLFIAGPPGPPASPAPPATAAARGSLQQDDGGSEVGQVKGAERAGIDLLDGNDADAGERSLLHAELLQAGSSAHAMAEVYRQRTAGSSGCAGRDKPKMRSCSPPRSVHRSFVTRCASPASTSPSRRLRAPLNSLPRFGPAKRR